MKTPVLSGSFWYQRTFVRVCVTIYLSILYKKVCMKKVLFVAATAAVLFGGCSKISSKLNRMMSTATPTPVPVATVMPKTSPTPTPKATVAPKMATPSPMIKK